MLRTLKRKAESRGLAPRLHQADMSEFRLPRRFQLVMIPFNAFIHNMTQAAQVQCLARCREHLTPSGMLALDTFFPGKEIVGAAAGTRVLEGEFLHPKTGRTMRIYDTRSFDRVEQVQHSINEIEILGEDGEVETVHRSQVSSRYIYKHEMELLLQLAGFARWKIHGDFERRPLTQETDAMIVEAWTD
jgi:hypothetical protein